MVQRSQQIELGDFRPGQRVKRETPGAAAKQVRAPPLQLSGTGSTENEAQSVILDEPVDFIEQCRSLLDLVDQDRMRPRGFVERPYPLRESPRRTDELHVKSRVEKVEARRVGKLLPEEGGLPGLPGSPEKGGLARRQLDPESPRIHGKRGSYSRLDSVFGNEVPFGQAHSAAGRESGHVPELLVPEFQPIRVGVVCRAARVTRCGPISTLA